MANGGRLDLVENASATGDWLIWPGGHGVFMSEATFGGGTVKLQGKSPNGTEIDVDGASVTANGSKAFYWPPGELRAHIATATAVYAYAVVIP